MSQNRPISALHRDDGASQRRRKRHWSCDRSFWQCPLIGGVTRLHLFPLFRALMSLDIDEDAGADQLRTSGTCRPLINLQDCPSSG